MVPELGGLADRLVDHRVERNDTPDELAPHWLRLRKLGSRQRQSTSEPAGNFGGEGGEQGGQPALRATEIGSRQHDAGGDDANADLGAADDGEHKGVAVCAPEIPELAARDDCRRDPGKLRRNGYRVAKYRGNESTPRAPQCQTHEKGDAVLRETRSQYHDRHGAHYSADHAEPTSAQRSAEVWLTNESRGHSGPVSVVELEPKRDIERETDRNPQPQAKEQRRPYSP